MNTNEKKPYIELPAKDISAAKNFFSTVFNWTFVDYGEDYSSFKDAGLNGGFYKSDKQSSTKNGAALMVFYSADLQAIQEKITAANGSIVKDIFSFPGGQRFHFADPNGNEYAVWSDK